MKKALLVLLAFGLVSVLLTMAWNEWLRDAYAQLFRLVAQPVYDALGAEDTLVVARRKRYINFVPFVSLVLVTPGIVLRRRLAGLVLGLFAIFVAHLVLNWTARFAPGMALPVVPAIVSDTLPFLIWLAVAYPALIRLVPGSVPATGAREAPQPADTHEGDGAVPSAPGERTPRGPSGDEEDDEGEDESAGWMPRRPG